MEDFLKEQWLGILGLIVGVPGLIALWFQRRPNTLDYNTRLQVSLLSPAATRMNVPLTIQYLDNVMMAPHLLRVRIVNTGKHAIQAEDYVDGISVKVEGAEVLDMFVSEQSVEGLVSMSDFTFGNQAAPDLAGFTAKPKLMNPRDWFELQMVSEGKPTSLAVSSRYAGQSRTMRDIPEQLRVRNKRIFAGSVVVAAAIAVILGLVQGWNPNESIWPLPLLIIFAIYTTRFTESFVSIAATAVTKVMALRRR